MKNREVLLLWIMGLLVTFLFIRDIAASFRRPPFFNLLYVNIARAIETPETQLSFLNNVDPDDVQGWYTAFCEPAARQSIRDVGVESYTAAILEKSEREFTPIEEVQATEVLQVAIPLILSQCNPTS